MSSARQETVDDLLRPILDERRLTAWCLELGIRPWTILRWRKGEGSRVHAGTVAANLYGADADRCVLGIYRVDDDNEVAAGRAVFLDGTGG